MKIRRALATAVAAAVTAPVMLLSVTPAFADTKPVAQSQNKSSKPTIKELEAAAAAAQKAYEEAVKARDEAQVTVRKAFEELSKDSHPLVAADNAAKQAAKDAAAAKTTADQAVTDAKAAIAALPADATEEQKTAAATALSEAEATATTAATAKTAADTKAAETNDAVQDARVAAARAASVADKALDDALAAKIAADAALAQAKKEAEEEGEDCEPENDLTAKVTGLPTKLVAGTTTAFSIRVTNGSDRHMDEVITYVGVHATDKSGLKDTGKFFRLQWSSESSPKWKNVKDDYIDAVGALKPGARTDLKMRLTLDKATPAGNGVAFIAADFFNEDGSCGGTPGADMYEFDVKAAGSKPGKTEDAKPKPAKTTKPGGNGHTPQGSASATPATNGNLAATGSSSATTSIALAGGAAVVLGAAAVFVVRRRKAGAGA
ncbi:LAETG motif-containing sortase-dependent surface protein [Streptomyces sp. DH18]|uniref:LAETG motif-containing sortase-dependent surface protein n=1 Tax=Streptomyces sp. DH18 TaxID=3040126 RepID=UPI002441A1C4|nr:LAETG motif-containing sortase-dependent surface protein [Streptomyces sp. DH18]MDG9685656.1 LAETG motif-containing sortase-dependent surface protein [Streptomyces sp. DH18]